MSNKSRSSAGKQSKEALAAAKNLFDLLQDDDPTDFQPPKDKKAAAKAKKKAAQEEAERAKKASQTLSKAAKEAAELQRAAFGKAKGRSEAAKGKPKKAKSELQNHVSSSSSPMETGRDDEFAIWQEKDTKTVNEQYKQDLTQAILLSQIEANERNTSRHIPEQVKVKEKTTMSLGEFHQALSGQNHSEKAETKGGGGEPDPNGLHREAERKAALAFDLELRNEVFSKIDPETSLAKMVLDDNYVFVGDGVSGQTPLNGNVVTSSSLQSKEHQNVISYNDSPSALRRQLNLKDTSINIHKREAERLSTENKMLREENERLKMLMNSMADGVDVVEKMNYYKELSNELSREMKDLMAEIEVERTKRSDLASQLRKIQDKRDGTGKD